MTMQKETREGFYSCIRYAWSEIQAPTDEMTNSRVKNLIYKARICYNKLNKKDVTMKDDLNELEKKLKMELTN